jgi:hypothetical protein
MSINPFTNNRFNFLDNDKKSALSKEKNKFNYEENNNSFIKPSRRDNDRRDNDRRDNDRRDNDRRSNFKSTNKENKSKQPLEFVLDEEMFPDLVPVNNKEINAESTKFKDMLNTEVIEEEFKGLKPGWIEFYKDKSTKQIIVNTGSLTPHEIRMNEKTLIEEDPNYIMNKTINFVLYNRQKTIREYDDINGEGTFYERFVMFPVYGPEYDTDEEESETQSDSYDDYDYSDINEEY